MAATMLTSATSSILAPEIRIYLVWIHSVSIPTAAYSCLTYSTALWEIMVSGKSVNWSLN